jgi:hypothetical protein
MFNMSSLKKGLSEELLLASFAIVSRRYGKDLDGASTGSSAKNANGISASTTDARTGNPF